MILEPFLQWKVICKPPEIDHCRMGMRVDQTGEYNLVFSP